MGKRGSGVNYISNKELTGHVSEWKLRWLEHLEKTGTRMPVTHYMAECFLKLANRYGMRPNFAGYTYIDDMRSEAVICCCKYAHNFNPAKSTNAFAYFTKIVHNAFLQFLGKEKKFAKFKFKLSKEANPQLAKYDYNDIKLGDAEEQENLTLNAKIEKNKKHKDRDEGDFKKGPGGVFEVLENID